MSSELTFWSKMCWILCYKLKLKISRHEENGVVESARNLDTWTIIALMETVWSDYFWNSGVYWNAFSFHKKACMLNHSWFSGISMTVSTNLSSPTPVVGSCGDNSLNLWNSLWEPGWAVMILLVKYWGSGIWLLITVSDHGGEYRGGQPLLQPTLAEVASET